MNFKFVTNLSQNSLRVSRIPPEYYSPFERKKKMKKAAFLLSLCLLFVITVNGQGTNSTHLINTFKINGTGKWDYLLANHKNKSLYVSNGTQVNVLNMITGDSIGVISNTIGVHGIALVPNLKKGYTSNGKTGDCTVFNTVTLKEISRVKTGENPDAIFYDEYSKKVFVFNGRSNSATVINPATDKVIANIPLGGKPETGVSDRKGKIYVNIEDKNEVVCFDANTFKVLKRFKLEAGEEPSGLAIDRLNFHLFVGCANKLMLILDAVSGKTISKLPIGDGCDGVAYDAGSKLAYSSNGEGTLTVVKEISKNKFTVVENIKTAPGARTITLDETSHHVFLSVGDRNSIAKNFRILEFSK
ncbi:YVTN family beta-propeller protein [Pedobacter sp. UYP24]